VGADLDAPLELASVQSVREDAGVGAQTGQQGPPRDAAKKGFSDPWAGKKRLLFLADTRTGYQHDYISHAMATIERLGWDSGAFVTYIRTDSQLLTKQPITIRDQDFGMVRLRAFGSFSLPGNRRYGRV
jgi:hypothetical protein